MMNSKKLLIPALLLFSAHAHSALVTGSDIISAPVKISDDTGATNTSQQGFNEQQNYLLSSNLDIDGGSIAAGTSVDSHMIFLNTASGNATDNNKVWTFTGNILGIVQQRADIIASHFLGAVGTTYELDFAFVGLEGNDGYSILDNQLTLSMSVSEPGDWIRVITASAITPAPVPVPAAIWLFSSALAGLFVGRRKVA